MQLDELQTPALLVDRTALRHNLDVMSAVCRVHGSART